MVGRVLVETDRSSSVTPAAPVPGAPRAHTVVAQDREAAVTASDQPAPAQPAAPVPAPAPAPQAAPEPPVVEVTIGRIEVTARPVVPPVTSVAAAQPPPPGPRLEEYLAERSRR